MNDKALFRTVWVLALPLLVENLLQTLLGTVDRYFAGALHDDAIAAIGVNDLIMNIYIAFFLALSVGASAILARCVGQKDYASANRASRQALLLSVLVGLLLGAISAIFAQPLLRLTGAEESVMRYALPYFYIVAVPCVLISMSMTLSASLRASKDTKTPMILSGLANILNIGLNWIFSSLGMGIVGLGLATTLSRAMLVVGLFLVLMRRKQGIHMHAKLITPDISMLRSIAQVGIPAGLEKLVMRAGQLIYAGLIISLGTNAYVAHSITGAFEGQAMITSVTLSVTTAVLVGISLGEGSVETAKRYVRLSGRLSFALAIVFGVIFFFFGRPMASFFTDTPEVIETASVLLKIAGIYGPFSALLQVFTGALQGAGDTKFPMYSTLFGIWVLRIGLGYLFAVALDMGVVGIWVAMALDIALRSGILYLRYRSGKWQNSLKVDFTRKEAV